MRSPLRLPLVARTAWALAAPRLKASALASALGVCTAAAIVLTGPSATAKSSYDSPYGYDKTWNAALRLVRVDLGMKVLEKDDANGYLLFEYRSSDGGNKISSGSIELIRAAKGDDVRVIVQLPQMPRYHEQVILDHLVRKMRDEYGDPPARKKELPPPPPDAGTDAPTE